MIDCKNNPIILYTIDAGMESKKSIPYAFNNFFPDGRWFPSSTSTPSTRFPSVFFHMHSLPTKYNRLGIKAHITRTQNSEARPHLPKNAWGKHTSKRFHIIQATKKVIAKSIKYAPSNRQKLGFFMKFPYFNFSCTKVSMCSLCGKKSKASTSKIS